MEKFLFTLALLGTVLSTGNIKSPEDIITELTEEDTIAPELPERDLTTPEIIKYWNYPVETHEAKTEDGYILTLHRIPHGRNLLKNHYTNKRKTAILLQHGLLCSSFDWVANFPDDSLGFMLADAGFDVWLGNARGNTYSRKHETLDTGSYAFWNFSWEEMARYDLPAMVHYTLNETGEQQLYYIGHSQGTTMIFAGLSENEFLQHKIKAVFALAPVTRLKNIYSPIQIFATFENVFKWLLKAVGVHQFLPSSKIISSVAQEFCPYAENFCSTMISLIAGYDKSDLNMTRIPVYLSHAPAGTSIKNMYHFAQLVKSRVFQHYDYGYVGNLRKYKWLYPPLYHFENVTTPMFLIGGSVDWLAAPKDVKWTAEQLPGKPNVTMIEGYNHLDFLWGMSAKTKVYEGIIENMKEIQEHNRK